MAVRKDEVNLQVTIGAGQAGNTLRDLKREARDIRRALERIPVGTKEFDDARAKLKQVTEQIAQAEGKAKELGRAIQDVGKSGSFMRNALSTAIGVLGAFNLEGIISSTFQFGQQLFNIGLNMDQLKAKTKTVFGDSETIVKGFAETNASALGLAQQQYINLATGIGDLLIPMGFAQDTAAQLSAEIVNQAGVLSEWSGGKTTTAEAADILNKALLGERDALNSLGIDIKDSLVQDELKKQGLQNLTGESRRQAEALVTLQLIQKQSASANKAFADNTDSAARKQAELRAKLQEVIQSMAQEFIPVVNIVLTILLKAAEYVIALGKALIAIPEFINQNKVAFSALGTAILAFNGASILAAANTLRQAAAQRIATIATNAQAAAQRVLNVALAANPIGVVVALILALAAGLVIAYNNSETFRRVIQGSFEAVKGYVLNMVSIFKDFGSGLSSFFTGNFEAAAKSFGSAFQRMNPFEVAKQLKTSFVKGYESIKSPEADVNADGKKAEGKGKEFGRAFNNGLDGEFDKLKDSGTTAGEKAAEAAKKALEYRLKEIEAGYLKEELAADRSLFNREISESDHAKKILELKRTQYEQQLAAFKRFNQAESREALEAQKALREITQQLAPRQETATPTLPTRQAPGVQSQFAGIETAATVSALREKYANILQVEQEGELARLDFQRNVLENKLQLLEEAGLAETEQYKAALEQKKEADEQYAEQKAELERRTAQQIIRQQEAVVDVTQQAFDLAIDLLGKDEAARKKNAAAIKALNIAQVTISGIAEIQGIWKNAAELGPIAGPIIGAIQTAVALGRTVAAISKIQGQKFATGGVAKFGYFGGKPHSGGGTKGVFEDGTMLEVEAGEAFAIVNKRNAPLLRALSAVNALGGNGVPFFEKGGIPKFLGGGLPTVSTTPISLGNLTAPAAANMGNMEAFVLAVNRFDQVVQQFPTEVKSRVVYTEIRDTASEVAYIEDAAAL
jgi:Skp family chaperone for outer membrane proteins